MEARERLAHLFPREAVARRIASTCVVDAIGNGLFVTISAVYFVKVIGLSPAQVGIALSIAGAVGFAGMLPVGALADRMGAREVAAILFLSQGLLFALYAATQGFAMFLVVVSLQTLIERSSGPVRRALSAHLLGAAGQVGFQAYLRSVSNGGSALGSLLAALALQADSAPAYRCAVLVNALSFLVCARITARLPSVGRAEASAFRRRYNLRSDRAYVAVALVSGLIGLHDTLLVLGIPLVLVTRTAAPKSLLTAVFVLNMALVVTSQIRFARRAETLDGAVAAHRWACAAAMACMPLFLLAERSGVVVSAGALLGIALLVTMAELWRAGGAWGLSYGLAPPDRHGIYQATFGLGRALQLSVGPALVSTLVVRGGTLGLLVMAGVFAALGVIIGPTVRWAERTGPRLLAARADS